MPPMTFAKVSASVAPSSTRTATTTAPGLGEDQVQRGDKRPGGRAIVRRQPRRERRRACDQHRGVERESGIVRVRRSTDDADDPAAYRADRTGPRVDLDDLNPVKKSRHVPCPA